MKWLAKDLVLATELGEYLHRDTGEIRKYFAEIVPCSGGYRVKIYYTSGLEQIRSKGCVADGVEKL